MKICNFRTSVLSLRNLYFIVAFYFLNLRIEAYIFLRLIEVSIKNGRKTVSMRVAHCYKGFSFFFSVDTSINRKNITILPFHLIFISFQPRKLSF